MLLLTSEARAKLEHWTRAGYPHETCGVLVGREEDGLRRVLRAVRARNRIEARACERYELDPGDLVAADREARAHGLSIVGIWHSHPDRPPEPSASDRAAAWAGWSYLILSVGARGVEAQRAWRLCAGGFQEEELRTADPLRAEERNPCSRARPPRPA